ncbi:type II secretion system F family protein [Blautia sp. HCP3S3_G3]|uniref:type II secretion system F family protein n=1 Tax=Blautia sp. HCP3S3_G3 TaxID=3438913 RepID=UPI003F8C1F9D
MGVHIILFVIVSGVFAVWKVGWFRLELLDDKKGRRLFLAVALAGNFLGLVVTWQSGSGTVYSNGCQLEKNIDDTYDEKFMVSVDGEQAGSIHVQVPEKESEDDEQKRAEENAEESLEQRLSDAVVLYNEEKNDPDYYYLPAEWEGKHLEWEIPGDHSGTLLAALSFFAALTVLVKQVQDEQEARKKRTEQLLMDYPGLVMKFTLLVQAGMPVRRAFQKMALDYRKKSPEQKRYAYEEIVRVCREMESGVSEAEAYRKFGERCGQIKYKTFSVLLIQNLQKGSRRMSELLEKESMEAWDERKRKARVMGEAAATKLLLPMMMMLAVVMAIIMVPAFLSFYG